MAGWLGLTGGAPSAVRVSEYNGRYAGVNWRKPEKQKRAKREGKGGKGGERRSIGLPHRIFHAKPEKIMRKF